MDNAESLEQIRQNWKRRIVAECEQMHQAIENLREFAGTVEDADFVRRVEELHTLYCEMANTITLRILLNGVTETMAGCDDTTGTSRESTS